MKIPRRILQIMPATGWAAEIIEGEMVQTRPLLGWAMTQDGSDVIVVGLVAGKKVEFADEQPGFDGYAYLPDLVADVAEEALYEDDDFDDEDTDIGPAPRRPSRLN
ncbi:MAG: hypothetical protein RMK99_01995 [Anaerolineales bacterium]|nr:hypothetical protein [Anaerolineales bacterium]